MELLSIVVPCWNEEAGLARFYAETAAVCAGLDAAVEFIFVDDGSRDGTLAALKELAAREKTVSDKNEGFVAQLKDLLSGFSVSTEACGLCTTFPCAWNVITLEIGSIATSSTSLYLISAHREHPASRYSFASICFIGIFSLKINQHSEILVTTS